MEEKLISMSEEVPIRSLDDALANVTKPEDYEKIFISHCKSKAMDNILSQQLFHLSKDSEYIAPNIGGKLALRIINNEKITYSILLYPLGDRHPNKIIWKGESQILAIKGAGSIKIRVLQINTELDINSFKPGYNLIPFEEYILKGGDVIANWDCHRIIEVVETYKPVVIESLEIKNPSVEFNWTFDDNLYSIGTIPSKTFLSRLKLIIDLAIEMEQPIPQILYDTIMGVGYAPIKFRAIEAMLLENHPDVDEYFQMALESNDPILSSLAQDLYNKIINH